MLKVCPHCKHRVRVRNLAVHLKECRVRRQELKREFNKRVTQSIEYRLEKLKPFDLTPENLESMPDIAFNDLLFRLETEAKQKAESLDAKQERLKARLAQIEDQKKQAELKAKAEAERRKIEEVNRLEQVRLENEKNAKRNEKREQLDKHFESQRPEPQNDVEDFLEEMEIIEPEVKTEVKPEVKSKKRKKK